MTGNQNYENYYRAYWKRNQEKLKEQRRAYRKEYNKKAYEKRRQAKIRYNNYIKNNKIDQLGIVDIKEVKGSSEV